MPAVGSGAVGDIRCRALEGGAATGSLDDVPNPPRPPALPPEAAAEPRRPTVNQTVTGLVLVTVGVTWLGAVAGVAHFRWDVLSALVLLIVGGGLVAGARTGAHGGLISVGLVLTVVIAVVSSIGSLADIPFTGGFGSRVEQPARLAEDSAFRLAVGELEVDLRSAALPAGGTALVEASVVIGRLVVRLPDRVDVRVEASAGAGTVRLLGASDNGLDVRLDAGDPDAARLVVEAEVGIGEVVVER